jgi:hypothetical protein
MLQNAHLRQSRISNIFPGEDLEPLDFRERKEDWGGEGRGKTTEVVGERGRGNERERTGER